MPDRMDFSESLGGWFIILFGESSIPSAKAGSESVTRFINKIWTGSRNMLLFIRIEVIKIPRTSTIFVESKNRIVFSMF